MSYMSNYELYIITNRNIDIDYVKNRFFLFVYQIFVDHNYSDRKHKKAK